MPLESLRRSTTRKPRDLGGWRNVGNSLGATTRKGSIVNSRWLVSGWKIPSAERTKNPALIAPVASDRITNATWAGFGKSPSKASMSDGRKEIPPSKWATSHPTGSSVFNSSSRVANSSMQTSSMRSRADRLKHSVSGSQAIGRQSSIRIVDSVVLPNSTPPISRFRVCSAQAAARISSIISSEYSMVNGTSGEVQVPTLSLDFGPVTGENNRRLRRDVPHGRTGCVLGIGLVLVFVKMVIIRDRRHDGAQCNDRNKPPDCTPIPNTRLFDNRCGKSNTAPGDAKRKNELGVPGHQIQVTLPADLAPNGEDCQQRQQEFRAIGEAQPGWLIRKRLTRRRLSRRRGANRLRLSARCKFAENFLRFGFFYWFVHFHTQRIMFFWASHDGAAGN